MVKLEWENHEKAESGVREGEKPERKEKLAKADSEGQTERKKEKERKERNN